MRSVPPRAASPSMGRTGGMRVSLADRETPAPGDAALGSGPCRVGDHHGSGLLSVPFLPWWDRKDPDALDAAVLWAPLVDRRLVDAVLPAEIPGAQTSPMLFQDANDLFLAEPRSLQWPSPRWGSRPPQSKDMSGGTSPITNEFRHSTDIASIPRRARRGAEPRRFRLVPHAPPAIAEAELRRESERSMPASGRMSRYWSGR